MLIVSKMCFFLVNRVSELLDYTSDELTGRNMYSLVHGQDVILLRKCHMDRKFFASFNCASAQSHI